MCVILMYKFSVIDLVLYGQKKSFRYSAKIGLWQTFRLSIFSAARNALTKATDFVTFGFSFLTSKFGFLSPQGKFERLCQ